MIIDPLNLKIFSILLIIFVISSDANASCILEGALCQKLSVNVLACEYNEELATKLKTKNFEENSQKSSLIHQFRITGKIIKSSSVACDGEKGRDLGLPRAAAQIISLTYNADNLEFCTKLKKEEILLVTQSCCDVLGSDQWCSDFEINSFVKN